MTKFSSLMTMALALVISLLFIMGLVTIIDDNLQQVDNQLHAIATSIDQALLVQSPERLQFWLPSMMKAAGVVLLEIRDLDQNLQYSLRLPEMLSVEGDYVHHVVQLPLMQNADFRVNLTYLDPFIGSPRWIFSTIAMVVAMACMPALLVFALRRFRRKVIGHEQLEMRAKRILRGERESVAHGSVREWPNSVSGAFDQLLADLSDAREERSRLDTLIRAFAAQDAETGLSNRLFFDSQLTTQLEDAENVGTHGVVMMIRLPDFDTLQETHGYANELRDYRNTLVNMLSTFVMRYPSALLARYFSSDFAVLLPHRTLKEADIIAAQLVKALDILPITPLIDREDVLHIGICAYVSGQSSEQVMESVEDATRNAVLLGGNGWCVFDRQVPDKGRGSVKWRTLLEQTLAKGGPHLYQKPAVTRDGVVHHREMMPRITDGKQVLLAAEYMPLVQQLGLTPNYDRLLVAQIIALSASWPEETLAMPVNVDSLLQRPFWRWLQEVLLQCPKQQRQRILFELAESDVCQYIERLRPILNTLVGLGCRLAVTQAGLTLVSTTYIKTLQVEIIKLHPGLVRRFERRTENQLFVQSLIEACKGTSAKVFAAGVRTQEEWNTLLSRGVYGGQGDFFAASIPVSDELKKYSPRHRV